MCKAFSKSLKIKLREDRVNLYESENFLKPQVFL